MKGFFGVNGIRTRLPENLHVVEPDCRRRRPHHHHQHHRHRRRAVITCKSCAVLPTLRGTSRSTRHFSSCDMTAAETCTYISEIKFIVREQCVDFEFIFHIFFIY